MANRLKMVIIHSVQLLRSIHWSQRRIARELGIDRETMRKYLECGSEGANLAISPAGSDASKPATSSGLPGPAVGGADADDGAEDGGDSRPALVPAGWQGDGGRIKTSHSTRRLGTDFYGSQTPRKQTSDHRLNLRILEAHLANRSNRDEDKTPFTQRR